MNPRLGLKIGALITGVATLVLIIAPSDWFADLLAISDQDVASFLVKRYAASSTAALFVFVGSTAMRRDAESSALLALSTWFAIQAGVAIWGVSTGIVGGMAWTAAFSDPLLAIWFYMLSRKAAPQSAQSNSV